MSWAATTPVLPNPDTLSLVRQVAQMLVVRTSGHLFDHEIRYPAWEATANTLTSYIQDLGIGGVILLGGSAAEVGLRTQGLQSLAPIPLLIAADIEEGVGQRFSGATWFPPPMALDAIAKQDLTLAQNYARAMGMATAQEAVAIGLNWVLAPVVDVNNNPQNPVINVRAFGQSPSLVSQLTQAFIQGAQGQGVLTTAKHFPGHGDTATDSHLSLPNLPHSLEHLQTTELPPFQTAIQAGVDAVMTAHLQVPVLDAQFPATLSPATLTRLLRHQMGFAGLIVTDALIMGAITHSYGDYEAAVLAVEAGADILLMPADPEGVIRALCEAVTIGRIPQERILASVERIWRAKQKITTLLTIPPESCHAWEQISPPPVQLEALARPETRQLATVILRKSMVTEGEIPSAPAEGGDNIVLVDDGVDCPFLSRTAPAITLPAAHHYQFMLIDQGGCRRQPQPGRLRPTLLQLFIRGNPFRSSADLSDLAGIWLETLQLANCLVGVVIYGSPYLLEQFRPQLDRVPYGFTYGQMPIAQQLVLTALLPSNSRSKGSAVFTD